MDHDMFIILPLLCRKDLAEYPGFQSEGTALHVSTSLGEQEKVAALLEVGADVNIKNIYGETVFHTVASSGNMSILRLLFQVSNKKCLNDKSKWRLHRDQRKHVHCTPLMMAAVNRNPRCAEFLLSHGVKLGEAAEACCALANKEDDVELMRQILNTGFRINQHRGYTKSTLLHEAAIKGNPDIISALLSRGAKVNARDRLKQTPLTHAIIEGHVLVARKLLAVNSEVNIPDSRGCVPLHHAALTGNPTVVTMLLDKGAKTEKREKVNYMMPHHKSLFSRQYQCQSLQVLLMRDCPIDAGSKVGSALTIAYSIQNERRGELQPCLALLFSHGACDDSILLKLALVYENGVDYTWLPALFQLIIHSGNDTADLIGILAAIEQWFFAVDHKYYQCLMECRREMLSLKEYTRIALRRHYRSIREGKSIWRCIENSSLPRQLKDYLKLFDICGETLFRENDLI